MRFLYQKPEDSYEELLSKTPEAEKDHNNSKVASAKAKPAVVAEDASPLIQKLTKEISALTTVVKSASMGGTKTKTDNEKTKGKSTRNNGMKGNGQSTNSHQKG